MSKKIVYFLRPGNADGYGYNSGEVGTIDAEDFSDLSKRHIVRSASDAEEDAYYSKLGLEPVPADVIDAEAARKQAEAEAEAEAEAARKQAEAEAEAEAEAARKQAEAEAEAAEAARKKAEAKPEGKRK
jgi:hypothetical protein